MMSSEKTTLLSHAKQSLTVNNETIEISFKKITFHLRYPSFKTVNFSKYN